MTDGRGAGRVTRSEEAGQKERGYHVTNIAFGGEDVRDAYITLSTRTGKELWREALPAGSNATPTTYLAPRSGRQMLVVSAGGAVGTTEKGDTVIAYAFPRK